MTSKEKLYYFEPAAVNLYYQICGPDGIYIYFACVALERALGWNDYSNCIYSPNHKHNLSPEKRDLLELLAGPHGLSILKMYRIKNNLKGDYL
jgi:hypothetical protein